MMNWISEEWSFHSSMYLHKGAFFMCPSICLLTHSSEAQIGGQSVCVHVQLAINRQIGWFCLTLLSFVWTEVKVSSVVLLLQPFFFVSLLPHPPVRPLELHVVYWRETISTLCQQKAVTCYFIMKVSTVLKQCFSFFYWTYGQIH